MADCLFAPINWVWESVPSWSGGAWTLPLSNLATMDTLAYARSASADPAATRFTIDLGQTRRFDTVALAWHNASANGKIRLTAAGAPPAFDHDFTSGTLPAGWTFSRPSIGTCFGPDGLLRTVAPGEPRFDHDPVTGAPRGILIEESRTNLIAHSNELSAWMTGFNATVDADHSMSLSGSTTADRATCTGSGGRLQATIALAAATTYSWSFVCKPIVGSFIAVVLINSELGNPEVHFDVSSGEIVFSNGALVNAGSQTLGDGRRRYWIGFETVSAGSFLHEIRFFAVGDSILVSDAQREIGSFPSSIIPTAGESSSRASDTLTCDTMFLDWWSPLPITVHAKVRRPHNKPSNSLGPGTFSPAFSAWNGAAHVVLHVGLSPEYGGSNTSMKAFAGYHLGAALGGDDVDEAKSVSMAASFLSGSSAMTVDNGTLTVSSDALIAASATSLFIGGSPSAGRLDGWVERVSLWTSRLADDRLVAGTTDWSDFGGVEWQSGWLDLVPTTHVPAGGYLPFGRLSVDGKLPADERDPRGATFLHVLPTVVDARAITVEVNDSANPSGFFQASMLFLAKAERPSPNIARGVSIAIVEDGTRVRSLAGGLHAHQRWRRRRVSGALASQRRERALATWFEGMRHRGTTRPLLFCLDPDAGIHADRGTVIGVLAAPAAVEHAEHDRWGWAFAIDEL